MSMADDDLAQLRTLVRRYAADHHDPDAARRGLDDPGGHDAVAWSRLCEELGLVELLRDPAVPRLAALATVQEELGRALAMTPWFATISLAGAALAALDVDAVDVLRGRTATLALRGDEPPVQLDDASAMTGTVATVVDAATAQVIVVPARTGDRVALCLVEPARARIVPRRPLDATRPMAEVHLDASPCEIVTHVPEEDWDRALDEVAVLVAADMLGTARACVARTVAYASQRRAFGRPIGSFQAVKHALADLHVDVEGVAALVADAARGHHDGDPRCGSVARMALAEGAEVLLRAADAQVRLHGGIGFTWEHDAHLYLRRATSSRSLLGRPDQQWDRAATLVGLGADRPDVRPTPTAAST